LPYSVFPEIKDGFSSAFGELPFLSGIRLKCNGAKLRVITWFDQGRENQVADFSGKGELDEKRVEVVEIRVNAYGNLV